MANSYLQRTSFDASDVTGEVFSKKIAQDQRFTLAAEKSPKIFLYPYYSFPTEEKLDLKVEGVTQGRLYDLREDWLETVNRFCQPRIENSTISEGVIRHFALMPQEDLPLFWSNLYYEVEEDYQERLLAELLQSEPLLILPDEEFKVSIEYTSKEVLQIITRWGIANQVNDALNIIKETYTTLHIVKLSISTDPEISERKRIRIELTVSGSPEEVLKEELCFKKQLYSNIDLRACELITITYNWEK